MHGLEDAFQAAAVVVVLIIVLVIVAVAVSTRSHSRRIHGSGRCPQCGSKRVTWLRPGHFRCDNCGLQYSES